MAFCCIIFVIVDYEERIGMGLIVRYLDGLDVARSFIKFVR